MMYWIVCRETWDKIDHFDTFFDACETLGEYVEVDKQEAIERGESPDDLERFYEIVKEDENGSLMSIE